MSINNNINKIIKEKKKRDHQHLLRAKLKLAKYPPSIT